MDDLDLSPLVKTVTVPWPVQEAFRRFTRNFGQWWPHRTHSVFTNRVKAVSMECRAGGKIFETRDDGEVSVWGTILVFEAPARVSFTWHPGREPDTAQEVVVTFTARTEGTMVELTHRGWEKLGDKAKETRGDYDTGWEFVLGHFTGNA